MEMAPYLLFNGTCEAAFKFYEKVLGGKILMMLTHGETPAKAQTPADWLSKIIHARMTFGNNVIMASDAPPGHYSKPQGFSVNISVSDPKEAERIFHALAENGVAHMPIAETFWAVRFGMCVDQFGTPWMVNCEKLPTGKPSEDCPSHSKV